MHASSQQAAQHEALKTFAIDLDQAIAAVQQATQAAWANGNPQEALANAVPYMQAFGHMVLAWIWLDIATNNIAIKALNTPATAYFYHYELPKIGAWLKVVQERDMTCALMREEDY